jgi:predicted aspartyl protease
MGVNRLLAGFFEPHGVDGIIGLHLLRHFDVQLDFAHGELRLYPPGGRSIPERSGTRCWIAGDHHLVTAGRCNDEALLWFLDTGMSGFSALVTSQIAAAAGVAPVAETDAHHAYGGGGQVNVDAVTVERLCVGDICRSQHRAVVLDEFPLETRFGFHLGGALAYDFLKPFTLELDFRAMRLRLS